MTEKLWHVEMDKEYEEKKHHCRCGSRENAYWVNDARGIPLAKVCKVCEKSTLAKYRPEVLSDSNYDCDEQIEEE